MKKQFCVLATIVGFVGLLSMKDRQQAFDDEIQLYYRRPVDEWPKPTIDVGAHWSEFKSLPKIDTSYFSLMEKPDVKLGKYLFLTLFYRGAIKYPVAAVITRKLPGLTSLRYQLAMIIWRAPAILHLCSMFMHERNCFGTAALVRWRSKHWVLSKHTTKWIWN